MHLEKNGCRRVSFCQSRSFLNDGVLLSKKKYQTISGLSSYKYVTRVMADTTATRAFLQNNPFIFQHAGELRGAVFVGTEPQPPLDEIHKQHSYAGLKETIAFFFSPPETAGPDQGPLEQLSNLAPDESMPAQKRPQYRPLTKAECTPLISSLGPIGIATAIAIHSPQED